MDLEEWEQEPQSAVKEKALVEPEWVGQVLASEPLQVEPEPGLEVEMGQE